MIFVACELIKHFFGKMLAVAEKKMIFAFQNSSFVDPVHQFANRPTSFVSGQLDSLLLVIFSSGGVFKVEIDRVKEFASLKGNSLSIFFNRIPPIFSFENHMLMMKDFVSDLLLQKRSFVDVNFLYFLIKVNYLRKLGLQLIMRNG